MKVENVPQCAPCSYRYRCVLDKNLKFFQKVVESTCKSALKELGEKRIQKSVRIIDLQKDSSIEEYLAYWRGKAPEERIAAIEFLRRQYHGSSARLQRSARVVQQTQ